MDKSSALSDASKKYISKQGFRVRPLLLIVLLLSAVVIYRGHYIVTDLLLLPVPVSSSLSSPSSKKQEQKPQQQQLPQQQQQQQLPPALRVSNFTGCCGTEGVSTFVQTCLTESACRNSKYYNQWFPYTTQDEADYLKINTIQKRRSPIDKHRRKICHDLADTLIPHYEWCRRDGRKNPPYPYDCGSYSSGGKSGPYDRTYLFPKGNLLFCGIPKVGITQWLQFLRFVNIGARDYQALPHFKEDMNAFKFGSLPYKQQINIWYGNNNNSQNSNSFQLGGVVPIQQQIKNSLYGNNNNKSNNYHNSRNWTKMVFIREPKERLLSAYIDKIENTKKKKNKPNITFPEFIDMIESSNITKIETLGSKKTSTGLTWYTDPHWRPQAWTCGISEELPTIDYISTMDYIARDTKSILQMVHLWDNYGQHYRTVPKRNSVSLSNPPPPNPLPIGDSASGFQQPKTNKYDATNADNSNDNNTGIILDDPNKHNHDSKHQMENYYTPELVARVEKLYWMDVVLYNAIMDVAAEKETESANTKAKTKTKDRNDNANDDGKRNHQIPTGKDVAMKIKPACSF